MKRDLDRKTVPFCALLLIRTDLMKSLLPIVFSLCLAAPAFANDKLNNDVRVLAGIAGDLRVVSENCLIIYDPLVGIHIAEALITVPNIDMDAVLDLINKEYEKSRHYTGSECYPDDDERLKTLNNLYNTLLDGLQQSVARGDYG